MVDESPQDELTRLRAELESHRQRELAELRSALAVAREEVAHYRNEAYRNADTARQLVSGYEQKITELKAKLEALTNSEVYGRRFPARN